MPAQYEAIRDSAYQRFLRRGHRPADAMRKAKALAARTWNKLHPNNPIGPHKEPR